MALLLAHWVTVFTGLLMWRPKDLRTLSIDDSSLESHDQHGDTTAVSTSHEGNYDSNINRTSSSNRSTGPVVEDDPVR